MIPLGIRFQLNIPVASAYLDEWMLIRICCESYASVPGRGPIYFCYRPVCWFVTGTDEARGDFGTGRQDSEYQSDSFRGASILGYSTFHLAAMAGGSARVVEIMSVTWWKAALTGYA